MTKVIWFIEGEIEETVSHVDSASDFLNSLKLVNKITIDTEAYEVVETEMVVDINPYISILLRPAGE